MILHNFVSSSCIELFDCDIISFTELNNFDRVSKAFGQISY